MRTKAIAVAFVATILLSSAGFAQGEHGLEEVGSGSEALAKQAQNPVGALISLPFQNNTTFEVGPRDRTQNVLNIQPVWPLAISEKWNLITRTIVPVISQPAPGTDRTNGLGDLNFTGFISPREPGRLIWGAGPALVFPTATDEVLGADKWSVGPSVVLLTMPGPWVLGSLFSNVWSVAGDSEAGDVNQFLWQYFINYNYPSGFYWTSAPIISGNWEASAGDQWTVPFGGGCGKLFKIGKRPVNTSFQAFYNVEKPQSGGDWSIRIQAQLLFPK
jgi:hypothetical protein